MTTSDLVNVSSMTVCFRHESDRVFAEGGGVVVRTLTGLPRCLAAGCIYVLS
jgi:hypothetical protein